ncbi:Metallo-dependent phosphatase [Rhizoctonia solani]|nr:Metallo-dependent phosphatase [Rhizoctonia solani]
MELPQPSHSGATYQVYTNFPLGVPIPRPGENWTRFICVSDTHKKAIPLADGDILIHAGDFTTFSQGFKTALDWIKELRHPQKVLIAGNHEFNLDSQRRNEIYGRVDSQMAAELDEERIMLTDQSATDANLTYLEASSAEIQSGSNKKWSIYGSPYTPEYGTMGFSYPRNAENIVWTHVPQNTEVLVTHGPPFGILDLAKYGKIHVGCPGLSHAVLHRLPRVRLHVYGHIHESRGVEIHQGSTGQNIVFVNAACRDLKNPQPIIVDLKNY